jgi:hypothetical protein
MAAAATRRSPAQDVPSAEIHLRDGGHFLLEIAADQVAELMLDLRGRSAIRRFTSERMLERLSQDASRRAVGVDHEGGGFAGGGHDAERGRA